MIKARASHADGTEIILLGLSRVNCERMLAGQPIHIDKSYFGKEILIIAGETEEAMEADLKKNGLQMPDAENRHVDPKSEHLDG